MGFINHAQLLVEFENEAVGCADVSWLTGIGRFKLDILGTAGHIYLDVWNDRFTEIHGVLTPLDEGKRFCRDMKGCSKGILTGNYFKGGALWYKPLMQEFLHSIEVDEARPTTANHATIVTAVLEAAIMSIGQSRPVFINELLEDRRLRAPR
jgi:predicted dehydrogenase